MQREDHVRIVALLSHDKHNPFVRVQVFHDATIGFLYIP
jgi:hypothetical protein